MIEPAHARLHGYDVLLDPGDPYPAIVSQCPLFNAPLVELVEQIHRTARRALVVVDVGAAIGDTVFLLKQRCPGCIKQFICIEGDDDFFTLLKANMNQFDDVMIIHQLLAREKRLLPRLVKHHPGTAAAVGEGLAEAVELDSRDWISAVPTIDIMKVDVDGLDGEVLAGSLKMLRRCKPAVIFEWHPKLITQASGDFREAFHALDRAGYDRYLWFNNCGTFSHFELGCSTVNLTKMAAYLLEVNDRADEHFDIIALHPNHTLVEVELAAMQFARHASRLG